MERTTDHAFWTDRLSDYLDDEMSVSDRRTLERHLEGCAGCRHELAELRAVASRARTLPDTLPDRDLWPGVAAAIGAASARRGRVLALQPRRRFSFTLPQLVAASLALMALSGGMVWLARLGGDRTDFPPLAAEAPAATMPAAVPVSLADTYYDEAIADLLQTLEAERAKLDPRTVQVLEENLAAIDRAISECREALSSDPANRYVAERLAAAQKRKLALLRRANAITRGDGTL